MNNWWASINCCHVAFGGFLGWIISTIIQNIRIAKVKAKGVELELRTKELEKKNGKELKEIELLKAETRTLKEIINAFINQQPKTTEKMETAPPVKSAPLPPPPPPMPQNNPNKNWENKIPNEPNSESEKEPIKVQKKKSHHETLKEALNKRRKKIEEKD